jgi:hypothetical protein
MEDAVLAQDVGGIHPGPGDVCATQWGSFMA